MKFKKPYRVLLYYKYVKIDDYETYASRHLKFCKALGLKGRILIAPEGINGTVSGTIEQTDAYMHALHMDPRFEDMIFKIDEEDQHTFKKIFVRTKDEIVTLGLKKEEDIDPNEISGVHLKPKDFMKALEEDGTIIIDGRNDYEYDLGHFKGALRPPVKAFKEFPGWIRENLSDAKDKKVLAYCTGGIRCEKLTGFLIKEGFKNVFQLDGGIVSYAKDPNTKGKYFNGKCYVFDERISVPVNTAEEYKPVSNCKHCGETCDRYINCGNMECNLQFFCCEECEEKHYSSCCDDCKEAHHHKLKIQKAV